MNDPDGNPTAQNIGDAIAPNVEHKLAWKVSTDWKTDLAKCKFEILVSDQGQLPMDLITIPATAKNVSFVVSHGTQTSANGCCTMIVCPKNAGGQPDTVEAKNQISSFPSKLIKLWEEGVAQKHKSDGLGTWTYSVALGQTRILQPVSFARASQN